MTWVIGANTPFGYGFIVSDVRVTMSDGSIVDCLQKVYRVGDFIAAGFSGSVQLGFEAIRDLQAFLDAPEKAPDECWIPEWVATEWAPRARELFRAASPACRKDGCSILMVGAHPTEDGMNGARPYTAVLRSPDFEPTIWNNLDSVQSIGSGANVEEYKALLGSSFEEQSNLMGEMMGPGGMARVMVGGFMRRVFREPTPGVSHHLQYFIVRRGGVEAHHYKPTVIEAGRKTTFQMPPLARGWRQLVTMLQREGKDATAIDEATTC